MAGKTKTESPSDFKLFEWVIKFMNKHGIVNIIMAGLLMIFMSFVMAIVMNPTIIFDKYREYDEQKHLESFNYRMKSNRSIQLLLGELLSEVDGVRCYIIELHNGKQNSSGLSFNYGSMTYENTLDSVSNVREDYAEFTLDRYPLSFYIYENGDWIGTTDELMEIDRKLALKLEANDSYAMAITTIYGIKSEIGFLGVSFDKNRMDNLNERDVMNKLRKFSNQLSPFLDGDNVK